MTFAELGLSPRLLAALDKAGFEALLKRGGFATKGEAEAALAELVDQHARHELRR